MAGIPRAYPGLPYFPTYSVDHCPRLESGEALITFSSKYPFISFGPSPSKRLKTSETT